MPITKLAEGQFSQVCARCDVERDVTFEAVARLHDEQNEEVRFLLPACAECGSVEILIPGGSGADDHPAPGSYGHLHRLLVNELSARIQGGSSSAASDRNNELTKWFPEGLVLRQLP
ncbi:MAG TPA: hypothetical protein VKP30_12920 [Polyangiaceae bacterium]|nr:hypothetical protein [Polyangiaceae bacterium]